MDLRVIDGTIETLKARIAGKQPAASISDRWPCDEDGRFLAYTDQEINDITHFLGIGAIVTFEDQPDPTLLAACQGKVTSRTEALAALASGRPPVTLETIAARVDVIESKVPAPQPVEELPS